MRPEKESIVREIQEQMSGAGYVFLADFTRMNTVKTANLKAKLHEVESRFQVVQNRLFRVAVAGQFEGIEAGLKGPTAVVFGSGDPAAVAKTLCEFIKTNEKMPVIKLGVMEGRILSAAEVEALASLPPKKVMQGILVGTLAAPMTNLVSVMNQKLASLVYVLKAAADKKSSAA